MKAKLREGVIEGERMHKAEDAKKLKCPMSARHNCVADGCAAWRWAQSASFQTVTKEEPHPFQPGVVAQVPRRIYDVSDYGYCGMAGRPEAWK